MAHPPAQENTPRRAQILDADYVPRDQAPNLPGTRESAGKGREGVSAVFVIMLCMAMLALGIAVVRGDADSGEAPAMILAGGNARAAAAGSRGDVYPIPGSGEPSLGVAAQTLSAPVAAYYSMKDCPLVPGAQVYAVDSDGPAAAAGILPGDVITAVDGAPIRTAEDLAAALGDAGAGQTVTLSLYRDGKTLEISAELAPATGEDESDFFHNLK